MNVNKIMDLNGSLNGVLNASSWSECAKRVTDDLAPAIRELIIEDTMKEDLLRKASDVLALHMPAGPEKAALLTRIHKVLGR